MRWLRGASLRTNGEACRESDESRTAQGLSMLERDARSHGWSENALKGSGMTIRDRRGRLTRAGVRALIVAMKPGNAGGSEGAQEGERAMNSSPENPPPPVPVRAQQGGEAGIRKVPAEPAVWTERRLTALVTGLKGNRWFRLIDKV